MASAVGYRSGSAPACPGFIAADMEVNSCTSIRVVNVYANLLACTGITGLKQNCSS